MKTPRSVLIVMALTASSLAHQALAARGGGDDRRGGGAPAAHFNGGGHVSVGHAPTFSAPHVAQRSEFHAERPEFHAAPRESFARPNVGSRPAIENRPTVANRPAFENRPAFDNRAEFAHRTPIEGHPDIVGRTGFGDRAQNYHDFFGRTGVSDHAGLGVRPSYVNHPEYFNRGGVSGRNGIVAGGLGRDALAGSWYHGDWHNWGGGGHGWYNRPLWWWGNNWWGAGYLPGYAAWQIPWSWGYWSYYNPYYTQPLVFGSTTVNYAQPIVMATPPAGVSQASAEDQAMQFFGSARDAFMNGEYQQALTQVDNAIQYLPNDAVLHEFRGLVLFALGDYHQSAASVYAALSVGPGWDWTTLSGFYPDTDVYTQQLRALEQYASLHPNQTDARFLLAYQYLTCGYTDQAVGQLQEVVQLNPKDQLSAQLLASLTAPQSGSPGTSPGALPPVANSQLPGAPVPTAPTISAVPVSVAALTGRWTATRPDGSTVTLNLGNDSKYDWDYNANGQAHNFAGSFSVADNLLILKTGDTPAMVGQVTFVNNRQFNFKMPGDNPNDPGLTFSRG